MWESRHISILCYNFYFTFIIFYRSPPNPNTSAVNEIEQNNWQMSWGMSVVQPWFLFTCILNVKMASNMILNLLLNLCCLSCSTHTNAFLSSTFKVGVYVKRYKSLSAKAQSGFTVLLVMTWQKVSMKLLKTIFLVLLFVSPVTYLWTMLHE